MIFYPASQISLVPGTFYHVTNTWSGDLDRNNNLRAGREAIYVKFVRYRDINAEMRAAGSEPMRNHPLEAVFEIEDQEQMSFAINSLMVGVEEPVRLPQGSVYGSPPKTSFMSQGATGWGRKKRNSRKTRKGRKSTSSSRVQRRSKTRKFHQGVGA